MGQLLSSETPVEQHEEAEIDEGLDNEASPEASRINRGKIGSRFNEWRKPVSDYGRNDPVWEQSLKSSIDIGDIEFGRTHWARARDAVNTVLGMLLTEIKMIAQKRFDGLKIERYIRQGSSRDGLKIIAPDEFDTLLQFHIEGIHYTVVNEKRNDGKVIPEFCRLEITQSMARLQLKLPKLCKEGVFCEVEGKVWLNASKLFQKVFASIIDSAVAIITQKILTFDDERSGEEINFKITRSINHPSVNITIHMDDDANQRFMREGKIRNRKDGVRQIDVDIVPGLLLRNDSVPDPENSWYAMECPVYAVIKRVNESDARFPEIVWRICSSGYEKHTLDLAQFDQRQRYIVTALRIMKTYLSKAKSIAKDNNQPPPQITTVLRSYFLKHIGFYLILFLCYIHPDVSIDGVQDVLAYFLSFLSVVLEDGRLLHFFHSNDSIRRMYPKYPVIQNKVYFSLLRNKSAEALNQARCSLANHLIPAIGVTISQPVSRQRSMITREFRELMSNVELF